MATTSFRARTLLITGALAVWALLLWQQTIYETDPSELLADSRPASATVHYYAGEGDHRLAATTSEEGKKKQGLENHYSHGPSSTSSPPRNSEEEVSGTERSISLAPRPPKP